MTKLLDVALREMGRHCARQLLRGHEFAFTNFYIAGDSWQASDTQNIDWALAAAMTANAARLFRVAVD